jgi:hypothetical protein
VAKSDAELGPAMSSDPASPSLAASGGVRGSGDPVRRMMLGCEVGLREAPMGIAFKSA